MEGLKSFCYGEQEVRVMYENGAPWWVLVDVLRALDARVRCYSAMQHLGGSDKKCLSIDAGKGRRKTVLVSEAGLFAVLAHYATEKSQDFRRWVMQEVLHREYTKENVKTEPQEGKLVSQPSVDTSLKRAAMLLRAAEHKAVPQDEQRRLISMAIRELTGTGLAPVPVTPPQETDSIMSLPPTGYEINGAFPKQLDGVTVMFYPLSMASRMAGAIPAVFDKFFRTRRLERDGIYGMWERVQTKRGDMREFVYREEAIRKYQEEMAAAG